ncbi:phospholipase D family protein [Tropicimonas sp. IMCC6043]|uniref:phospholipase D family protein n=1 Tax=Tropicimonas sp. IMCC6043 TaxID=2510645 RepID=UPI00101D4F75|nr:phospholipase D family protein [Tropicimonas sp. IMCC6043]RYH05946.1 phospholipase D family protein [Tropicimonas sp. IMCC6043]
MRFFRILAVVLVIVAAGILGLKLAFPLPEQGFQETAQDLSPAWNGPLGMAVQPAIDRHPGLSGVRPLADGLDAFAARIALMRAAMSSIDAQYYIWQDDTTGLMLLDELRNAAERGVHVRLLVDDNGIPGLDALLAELDAMPSAEVRIFNPFTLRNPKLLSYLFDFRRLNRRMHNKSMTFDGVASIVGGRNIGDIYFEYGEGTHYFDVDAIAVGPIVDDVTASFAAFWESGSSYAADRVLAPAGEPAIAAAASEARESAIGAGYRKAIEDHGLSQRIAARELTFEWGEATLFVDDPSKGLGQATEDQIVVEKLFALAAEVETSLDLVSAYFIPGPRGAALLEDMARNGVRVRVLTNSLEATDVMPVHSAYMRYRKGLVESGVELLELKAMREKHVDRSLPEILSGSASGLHAKVFGFDGTKAFIGSYNLDPRSARLNTEMGILIESPTIAASLARTLDRPSYAYRVQENGNGHLEWTEETSDAPPQTYDADPNTTVLQRGMARLVGWLPVEWML